MEFYAYPSPLPQPSSSFDSSSSSLSSFGIWFERISRACGSAASAILRNRLSALFTFFFALVFLRLVSMELVRSFCLFAMGSFLGALTGALLGQETESGFFHGATVGAISGAVFSIDVFVSSLHFWHSDDSGLGCLLYLIDVIASLLSGRPVRERIGPAMLRAVQSQMSAAETSFEEVTSIFGTGGTKGLSRDSVEKIPKIKITSMNNEDASGERVSCSVCLQDFQLRETVRSLPHCHHMFHLLCIDGWLVSHGSCPLCRRSVMLQR